MDHKAFAATIPASDRAALSTRSNAAGLLHLAGHLGVIIAPGALIAWQVPFWPLLLLPQGIALVFLFTLEHEATHKTPFASASLNEWVGRACGLVLLLPFTWFRSFHLAHHRWTNIAGQDPELEGGKPETTLGWVWHISGLPYWAAGISLLVRLARGREAPAYLPAQARRRAEFEARIMLALYAGLALTLIWSPMLFWVWIAPVLLGQPFLRLYLLAEHGDCPQVANMLENTRTTFTNRIVRFFAWNMPYHVEHHSFPAVPFHRLPDLHSRMRAHLRVTAPGYAAFTRAYLERRRDDVRDAAP